LIGIEDLDKDVSGCLERILSALEVKALQKEYSRLFLKGTVPICDSSYNRNADALSAVATFYKAFGLTPKTGESPDSLSYELEFLSILSLKRALARNQEESEIMDGAYSKFLNESLSSFVEKFAGRVEAAAPNRFYETITEFLKIMMEKETA
jgi:TorA maturation chaperone TorD